MRFALLPKHQVHAIILDPEPQGLHGQLWRLVRHLPDWQTMLEEVVGNTVSGSSQLGGNCAVRRREVRLHSGELHAVPSARACLPPRTALL